MGSELAEIEARLRADVSYLSETLGPRNPTHYGVLNQAADWISDRWRSGGHEVKRHSYSWEGKEYVNIEVEIRGRARPSEIVILSAQYDTHPDSPGANNNGSGMAVLLELADRLRGAELDRTFRLVAFTNQEPPYSLTEGMGSLRYARHSREQGEDIRVMLSMDAIGVYRHEPGTQRLPFPFGYFYPDRGDFLAFIADLGTRSYLVQTTRGFKKGSAFPIEAGAVPRWVEGASWSDHGSFWDYGYRAIQITDTGAFRSPFHVTSEDTMEKMDFGALARITLGMYGAVLELTTTRGL
jgi:hypothetical protein